MSNLILTNISPMPWGKYKGQPLGEIPFDYLYRFYKKGWIGDQLLIWFEQQLKELEEAEIRTAMNKPPKKYLIEDYEYKYPFAKKK